MARRLQCLAPAVLALAALMPAAPVAAQSVEDLQRRLQVVENKLASQGLTQMVNDLQQVRDSVDELSGRIDVLERRLEKLSERQRQMYADLDERLRALETAPARSAAGGSGDGGETGDGTSNGDSGDGTGDDGQAQGDDGSSEQELYDRAFETLRAGSYAKARETFQKLLSQHSEGQYTDNARYWIGESHYVVREFDKAREAFQAVLDKHPDSAKRPDALLKLGFIDFEEGDTASSRQTLKKVIEQYPESAAADRARQRLERIGG